MLVGRECSLSAELYFPDSSLPRVPIPIPGLIAALNRGDVVYMDDAQIEMEAVDRRDDGVLCTVRHGGVLLSRKEVTVQGIAFQIDALTEKDLRDAAFGIAKGVDYIGVSFVRRASDMEPVRRLIDQAGARTKIIAKIEKREALENLDSIPAVADGLMDLEASEIRVMVDHPRGEKFCCPECALALPCFDHGEDRRWRHLDSCQIKTILAASTESKQQAEP